MLVIENFPKLDQVLSENYNQNLELITNLQVLEDFDYEQPYEYELEDGQKLISLLQRCPNIQKLFLENQLNRLIVDEETVILFSVALQNCKDLRCIWIDQNVEIYKHSQIKMLFDGICQCKQLEVIKLEYQKQLSFSQSNKLNIRNSYFHLNLPNCSNLQKLKLNLSNNYLVKENMIYLGNQVDQCKQLISLNLDFTQIRNDDNQISVFFSQILHIQLLTKLKLFLNEITMKTPDLIAIGNFISSAPKLKSLKLQLNLTEIDNDQIAQLSKQLETLSQLENLQINLGNNQITQRGLLYFTQNITKCKKLSYLSLNFNSQIKDDSQEEIDTFKDGSQQFNLKELYLLLEGRKISNYDQFFMIFGQQFFSILNKITLSITHYSNGSNLLSLSKLLNPNIKELDLYFVIKFQFKNYQNLVNFRFSLKKIQINYHQIYLLANL